MTALPTILLLEDDPAIARTVAFALQREGYAVVHHLWLDHARRALEQPPLPAAAILDVGLPDGTGLDLCRWLRTSTDARRARLPVLMLTARHEEIDRVLGLELGADDYVTKPFSPRELVARVKAALRRIEAGAGSGIREARSVLSFKHVHIDAGARKVSVDDNPVELTAIEFDLLKALAENRGRVLSREQLLEKVWGGEYFGEIRVVDVHLGHIRQKLGRDDLIVTVRGVGYRFEDESL